MKFTKYVSLCVMVCASMEVNAGGIVDEDCQPNLMTSGSSVIIPDFMPFRERQEGEGAVAYQKEKKEYEKHQNKSIRDANRAKEKESEELKAKNQAELDKAERERFEADWEAGREAREAEALRKQEETECRRIEKEKKKAEKCALAIAAQKAEEERLRKEKENEVRKRIESGELVEQITIKSSEVFDPGQFSVKANRILIGLGGILVLEEVSKEIYPIPIQARISAACLWCNGVNIVFGKQVVKSPVRNMGRGAAIASIVFAFSSLGNCLRADGGCFDSEAAAGCRQLFLGCCILGGLVKPVVSYVNAQIHSKNYDPSGLVIGALIGLALLDSSLFSHEDLYSNMEHVLSLAAVGDFARLLIDEV